MVRLNPSESSLIVSLVHLQALALNGTVQTADLANVTITVPASWATEFRKATVTGRGYLQVRKP